MATSGPRRASPSAPGSKASQTRAALVAATIQALQEVGFGGASARDIAARAGCNQSLVFYHFGSVTDLLLAALDDVSARRLAAYQHMVAEASTLAELIESARTIFSEDLDSGHVTVLVEMITGAQAVPELGAQVSQRLAPWREFAETALRRALAGSPVQELVPAAELAHGVMAGFLGLEMLANLDGDRGAALALFDRARLIAGLLDLVGAAALPTGLTPGGQP
ncbi:MAG: TetR/AcrR family transcriptional regulator [Actinomycetota bacterium]|nr:TetR/AcrR family transcriptional regulator [Actinomycetota bacterium]